MSCKVPGLSNAAAAAAVIFLLLQGCAQIVFDGFEKASDESNSASSTNSGGAGGMGGASSLGGASGMAGSGGIGETPTDWSCLGTLPPPDFGPGDQIVTFEVARFGNDLPVTGAFVEACLVSDFLCDNVLTNGVTSSNGQVTFSLTTSGPIYVESTSSVTTNTLTFVNGPVAEGGFYQIASFTDAELSSFAAQLGGKIMPNTGHIAVIALDCKGNPATGVEFVFDNATQSTLFGYIGPDGNLDPTATQTLSSGRAIFINLPAGFGIVTASLTGGTLVSDREVFARGNWLSNAPPNSPTPAPSF